MRTKQTTCEGFYAVVGQLDAVTSIVGNYPYKTEFETRYGRLLGFVQSGSTGEASSYFLVEEP